MARQNRCQTPNGRSPKLGARRLRLPCSRRAAPSPFVVSLEANSSVDSCSKLGTCTSPRNLSQHRQQVRFVHGGLLVGVNPAQLGLSFQRARISLIGGHFLNFTFIDAPPWTNRPPPNALTLVGLRPRTL